MDKLFGVARPEHVIQARIELKVPTGLEKNLGGRPLKVWTGSTDADEVEVHYAICQNPILSKLIKHRRLAPEGVVTLHGRLVMWDEAQVIKDNPIEIDWIDVGMSRGPDETAVTIKELFDLVVRSVAELKQNYADHVASVNANAGQHLAAVVNSSTQAIAKVSEAFSAGLGKMSEQGKELGQFTRDLAEDRKQLNAALLTAITEQKRAPGPPSSPMDTVIKGISMLQGFATAKEPPKPGSFTVAGKDNRSLPKLGSISSGKAAPTQTGPPAPAAETPAPTEPKKPPEG